MGSKKVMKLKVKVYVVGKHPFNKRKKKIVRDKPKGTASTKSRDKR